MDGQDLELLSSVCHLGIRNCRVAQPQKNYCKYWELVMGEGAGGRENKYDDVLLIAAHCFELFPLPRNGLEWHSELCLSFSTERKPELFLFRGMVRNGIPRGYFYFWSTGRNSELFSLQRKGSERNAERLLPFFAPRNGIPSCFLFRGRVRNGMLRCLLFLDPRNGIPSCFLFHGRVRNGIPKVSVPRNSRNSVGNNHLFRLFRLPRNYIFVGNSQP